MLLVAVVAGLAAAVGVRWWQYEDHVLPGVQVAGVDVGGLSDAETAAVLAGRLGDRLDRKVPVRRRRAHRPHHARDRAAARRERDVGRRARGRAAARSGAPARAHRRRRADAGRRADACASTPTVRRAWRASSAVTCRGPARPAVRMHGVEPVVVDVEAGRPVARPAFLRRLRASALGGRHDRRGAGAALRAAAPHPGARAGGRDRARARLRAGRAHPRRAAGRHARAGDAREAAALPARGTQLALGFDRGAARPRRAAEARPVAPARHERAVRRQRRGASRSSRRRDGLDVDPWQLGRRRHRRGGGRRHARRRAARCAASRPTGRPPRRRRSASASGSPRFTTDMGTSSSNRIHNVHLMADYIDGTIVEPGRDVLVQRDGRPAHDRSAASSRAR